MRHLPGEVCLECRTAWAPPVSPSPELERDIRRCLEGDPLGLVVLKTRGRPDSGASQPCSSCGARSEPSILDLALGENQGLVIEGVRGGWCWECRSASLAEQGLALRQRLAWLDLGEPCEVLPSLLYDTPRHPRSVQFEVTTLCNLQCEYCTHRYLERKSHVDLPAFLRYLDRIRLEQVDNVDFTGLGEATLHPVLPEMVREVCRRGRPSDVRIVTNGFALTARRFQPLCEAGVTSFAFSIDSLDPLRFARQRGGANLATVLANLRALAAFRERNRLAHLKIKIKSVLVEDPYRDAEPLLCLSAELGLEMPHFSCVDSRVNAKEQYREPWLMNHWAEKDGGAFLLWSERRWQELTDIRPSAPSQEVSPAERAHGYHHPALAPEDLCRWAVDAAFVAAGGGSLACCEQMIDLPRTYFGWLERKPMEELWQGDLLWSYRLPLSLGLLPRGCVGCPRAPRQGKPMEEITC